MSKFGKHEGLLAREIFADAAYEAFSHCPKLNPKGDIKAMFIGHMGEAYEHQGHTGSAIADWAGLTGNRPRDVRRLVLLRAPHCGQEFTLSCQGWQMLLWLAEWKK